MHSHRKQQAVSEEGLTDEQINKLDAEEVDKLFSIYEAKLSGQMVKSLGKSIIRMYSVGACAILGMSNQNALGEDLESDPFLNSALQRSMCELYCRFGSFLAPLNVGLITSRHYLSKRGVKMEMRKATSKQPATPSKYAGLGAAMASELIIGFWFGIGVTSAIGEADGLNHFVGAITGGK